MIGEREKSGERFELKKKGARAIAGRRREYLRSLVWSVVSSEVRNEEQVFSGWGRSWIIHSFAKRRERPGVEIACDERRRSFADVESYDEGSVWAEIGAC